MVFRHHPSSRGLRVLAAGLLLAALGLGGCARLGPMGLPFARTASDLAADATDAARWDFFATPGRGDPWTLPIASWRLRQRAGPGPPASDLPAVSAAPTAPGGPPSDFALGERYDAFIEEQRRELARDVLRWVQALARERYVGDGPIDRWPTLPELLRSAGDDCDGLELLSYHALRQLGFPSDRIYRAILRDAETAQHHMVTLWFEDPRDPWVLDPTDVITSRLRRLSRISGWIPLKLFSETDEFTVTRLAAGDDLAADDARPGTDASE